MKINENFVLRSIYGKHILMPIRSNNIIMDPILLNDVAAHICKIVSDYDEKKDLFNFVMKYYLLSPDSVEFLSIENFLNSMIDMKLIIVEK